MARYQFKSFQFDSHCNELTRLGGPANKVVCEDLSDGLLTTGHIPPNSTEVRHKVAQILHYFLEHPQRVISKEELLNNLWQQGEFRESSLVQSIRELRKVLNDDAKQPSYIKTVPQKGYMWLPETECLATPPATTTEQYQPAESALSQSSAAKKTASKWSIAAIVAISCLIFIAVFYQQQGAEQSTSELVASPSTQPTHQSAQQNLLVFPFINNTQNTELDWVELGLADMLAIDLQRAMQSRMQRTRKSAIGESSKTESKQGFTVTRPTVAHTLLAQAELPWPTFHSQVKLLLEQNNYHSALLAEVSLQGDWQILNYQVLTQSGEVKSGEFKFASLPAAMAIISQQLSNTLLPATASNIKVELEDPVANQAIAKGMQALETTGATEAARYFTAALSVKPDSAWARAFLARTHISAGLWPEAEREFNAITEQQRLADPVLDAYLAVWKNTLRFKKGQRLELAEAIEKAERAKVPQLISQSYRLKAEFARERNDWTTYQQALKQAQQSADLAPALTTQVDKLFYLGLPNTAGLEKNPYIDQLENQPYILSALKHYQQSEHREKIAASHYAIAQNYSFALAKREQALMQAIVEYRALQQPYELAEVLSYAGFYFIQLKQGARAEPFLNEAEQISAQLGAQPLNNLSRFYLAFALMDQGLDHSTAGRPQNRVKLLEAKRGLKTFIETVNDPLLRAYAFTFLGWVHADLGEYSTAIKHYQQAEMLASPFDMPITKAYNDYSLMRAYLALGEYPPIFELAKRPLLTRLQYLYWAQAQFEHGDSGAAITTLKSMRQLHPLWWQAADDAQLALYQQAQSGQPVSLPAAVKAHVHYCETDWLLL